MLQTILECLLHLRKVAGGDSKNHVNTKNNKNVEGVQSVKFDDLNFKFFTSKE